VLEIKADVIGNRKMGEIFAADLYQELRFINCQMRSAARCLVKIWCLANTPLRTLIVREIRGQEVPKSIPFAEVHLLNHRTKSIAG
jgi:hypothetical protein